MPRYFFDTSALVKLYHFEAGTPIVDHIAGATENLIRISRLTAIEMVSAFAIKVRTNVIDREDADLSQDLVDHFVAADRVLCEIAEQEGLSVVRPAQD